MLAQLAAAFMLLTRLPVGRFAGASPPAMAGAVWAFPIVGLVVGAVGGAVYGVAHGVGMPPLLASAWTLAATMTITGALHEDGLADTADGFGGGRGPDRKLDIMRDSRIGGYGALALFISLIVRVGAITALERPALVAAALAAAAGLGRGGIIVMLLMLRPARSEGMGAAMGKPANPAAAAGLLIALVAAFLALRFHLACLAIALALVAALAVIQLARRQIGGYTGDVLGAGELAVECVVLTAVASFPQPWH